MHLYNIEKLVKIKREKERERERERKREREREHRKFLKCSRYYTRNKFSEKNYKRFKIILTISIFQIF